MSTRHLRNISLKDYQTFLDHIGCKHVRTTGGHYHYVRNDLMRPITLQSHIDPVPEFIIKTALESAWTFENPIPGYFLYHTLGLFRFKEDFINSH